MRLNVFVAQATGISRRKSDILIKQGRVLVAGKSAELGMVIAVTDNITLDGKLIRLPLKTTTIMLNKPVGYVVSRSGQGGKTIYDLLPRKLHDLKPVGRLDKESSGLIILTNDGQLANKLAHPSFNKSKIYQVTLDKVLNPMDRRVINAGIQLEDGISRLRIDAGYQDCHISVTMSEGKNRQIRRTFAKQGYKVLRLHRISFGNFNLGNLRPGEWKLI
jgi:23S rRNA pseudouridine2605 synthase